MLSRSLGSSWLTALQHLRTQTCIPPTETVQHRHRHFLGCAHLSSVVPQGKHEVVQHVALPSLHCIALQGTMIGTDDPELCYLVKFAMGNVNC